MKKLLNSLEDCYFLAVGLPISFLLLGLIRILTFGAIEYDDAVSQAAIVEAYEDYFDGE